MCSGMALLPTPYFDSRGLSPAQRGQGVQRPRITKTLKGTVGKRNDLLHRGPDFHLCRVGGPESALPHSLGPDRSLAAGVRGLEKGHQL